MYVQIDKNKLCRSATYIYIEQQLIDQHTRRIHRQWKCVYIKVELCWNQAKLNWWCVVFQSEGRLPAIGVFLSADALRFVHIALIASQLIVCSMYSQCPDLSISTKLWVLYTIHASSSAAAAMTVQCKRLINMLRQATAMKHYSPLNSRYHCRIVTTIHHSISNKRSNNMQCINNDKTVITSW